MEKFMEIALREAEKARGLTESNPLVGAVVVKNNQVIGKGYHKKFGGPHAEVEAIQSVEGDIALQGATLYVTLEPCSHQGKTPPCTDLILSSGIKKVLVASLDPNPLVKGKGLEKLKDAGLKVSIGLLENEALKLNEAYFHWMNTGMPFCAVKTAMTLDGKIASFSGDSKWITCEASRKKVHDLRQDYQGILTGIGTVLKDNPQLNVRHSEDILRQPQKIIIDTWCKTPLDSKVLEKASERPPIFICSERASFEKIKALRDCGADLILVRDFFSEDKYLIDMKEAFKKLGERGIKSVLVEAGGTLNASLFEEGLVQKIYSFIAPKIIGGKAAKTSVEGQGIPWVKDHLPLTMDSFEKIGSDLMLTAYVQMKEGTCLQES